MKEYKIGQNPESFLAIFKAAVDSQKIILLFNNKTDWVLVKSN